MAKNKQNADLLNRIIVAERQQASMVYRVEGIEKSMATIQGRINSLAQRVRSKSLTRMQLVTLGLMRDYARREDSEHGGITWVASLLRCSPSNISRTLASIRRKGWSLWDAGLDDMIAGVCPDVALTHIQRKRDNIKAMQKASSEVVMCDDDECGGVENENG